MVQIRAVVKNIWVKQGSLGISEFSIIHYSYNFIGILNKVPCSFSIVEMVKRINKIIYLR